MVEACHHLVFSLAPEAVLELILPRYVFVVELVDFLLEFIVVVDVQVYDSRRVGDIAQDLCCFFPHFVDSAPQEIVVVI